jgi:hypothetical protein
MQCMPANLNDDSFIDTGYPSLIVIDDLMRDAKNSKDVCEIFVEGSHHRNIGHHLFICLAKSDMFSKINPQSSQEGMLSSISICFVLGL